MTSVLQVLDIAVQAAFVALALFTLTDWIRHRDPLRVWLVVALVSLSALVVLTPVAALIGLPEQLVTDLALVLFALSGYALLMFRNSLIPLGTRLTAAITAWTALVALIGVIANLSSNPQAERSLFQLVAVGLILVTWVLCVIEPIFRLGLASIGRPSVEGSRLRSLSLGYAGLVAVIIASTVAGPALQSTTAAVVIDSIVLVIVPLMYASFAPPLWLRQLWSRPEEEELRSALHELLLYSSDRATLATRALAGGARMVGAPAGFRGQHHRGPGPRLAHRADRGPREGEDRLPRLRVARAARADNRHQGLPHDDRGGIAWRHAAESSLGGAASRGESRRGELDARADDRDVTSGGGTPRPEEGAQRRRESHRGRNSKHWASRVRPRGRHRSPARAVVGRRGPRPAADRRPQPGQQRGQVLGSRRTDRGHGCTPRPS